MEAVVIFITQKTLIKFKKTSSSPPIFVYFTAHFDDNGGDMSTYPKEFKNQVYIVAYGIEGMTDHVDPEVYDAHETFEIDKTKMKMLVPLDMNGKKILNTNFDLKFSDLFKSFECTTRVSSTFPNEARLVKNNDNQVLSFSFPIGLLTFVFKDNIYLKERKKLNLYFHHAPNRTLIKGWRMENVGFNELHRYSFSEDLQILSQLRYVDLYRHEPITRTYDIILVITYM